MVVMFHDLVLEFPVAHQSCAAGNSLLQCLLADYCPPKQLFCPLFSILLPSLRVVHIAVMALVKLFVVRALPSPIFAILEYHLVLLPHGLLDFVLPLMLHHSNDQQLHASTFRELEAVLVEPAFWMNHKHMIVVFGFLVKQDLR